jgi:hypothetical protein
MLKKKANFHLLNHLLAIAVLVLRWISRLLGPVGYWVPGYWILLGSVGGDFR